MLGTVDEIPIKILLTFAEVENSILESFLYGSTKDL
jgi:hypothetical protein